MATDTFAIRSNTMYGQSDMNQLPYDVPRPQANQTTPAGPYLPLQQYERSYVNGQIMQRPVVTAGNEATYKGNGNILGAPIISTGTWEPISRPQSMVVSRPGLSDFDRANLVAGVNTQSISLPQPAQMAPYQAAQMQVQRAASSPFSARTYAPGARQEAGAAVAQQRRDAEQQALLAGLTPEAAQEKQLFDRETRLYGRQGAVARQVQRAGMAKEELKIAGRRDITSQQLAMQEKIATMSDSTRRDLATSAETMKVSENEKDRNAAMGRLEKSIGADQESMRAKGLFVDSPEFARKQQSELTNAAQMAAMAGDVALSKAYFEAALQKERDYTKAMMEPEWKRASDIQAPKPAEKAMQEAKGMIGETTQKPAGETANVPGDMNGDGVVNAKDVAIANGEIDSWNKVLLANKDQNGNPLSSTRITQIQERMKVLRGIKPIKG